MTRWVGSWQVVERTGGDGEVRLAVTLGTGLLDEPLIATGALSVALAAVRRELARPVAGVGGRSAEVDVDLGTDTATVTVRGPHDVAVGAWSRLADAFRSALVTDDLEPLRPGHPGWPADLVQRAGANAAALAPWRVVADDVHERARELLPDLDPRRGLVGAAYATDDPDLVPGGGPAGTGPVGPGPRDAWADGTVRLPDPVTQPDRSAAATVASGSRAGVLPGEADGVLLSALVPRCAAGLAAADLLLAAARDAAGWTGAGQVTVGRRLVGLGAHLLAVLETDAAPEPGTRARLAAAVVHALATVPDDRVAGALLEVPAAEVARLERERVALGLRPDAAADLAAARWSLDAVVATLHVPADEAPVVLSDDLEVPEAGPGLAWPAGARHDAPPAAAAPDPGTAPGPVAPVPPPDLPTLVADAPLGRRRVFRAWSRHGWGDHPATRTVHLVVGEGGVLTGRPGRRSPVWSTVDATRVLAVLEDQAGTLTVLDRSLRLVAVHPRLFRRPRAVADAVGALVRGAPRFSFRSDLDGRVVEERTRRSRLVQGGVVVVTGAVAVALVVAAVRSLAPGPGVPEVPQSRVEIGEAVELGGGGTMTVTAVERTPSSVLDEQAPEGASRPPFDRVVLDVDVCAGDDPLDVAPDDFWVAGVPSASLGEPVTAEDPLPPGPLAAGDCTAGQVAFEGFALDDPKVGYETDVDDAVWYQPGRVPDLD